MFGSPKNNQNTPRFFCDNCGVEVAGGSKSCPGCGRFFSSVRCPSCGFVGDEAAFERGCPSCGYSAGKRPPETAPREAAPKGGVGRPAPGLPFWVYILTAASFTAILAALFFAFAR